MALMFYNVYGYQSFVGFFPPFTYEGCFYTAISILMVPRGS